MKRLLRIMTAIEENMFVRSVRGGLVAIIPILMVGAFALVLMSFPLAAYQSFITDFASGFLLDIFNFVYQATFGMLSVYMTISIAYTVAKNSKKTDVNIFAVISSALAAFLISVGFASDNFSINALSAVGMFSAIISSTTASFLYIYLSAKIRPGKIFFDGSNPSFNRAIFAIVPMLIVCLLFATVNVALLVLSDIANVWQLIIILFNKLFSVVGGGFFGGLLLVFISSFLWFFGIHGSDVLESVSQGIFIPAIEENIRVAAVGMMPEQIVTKTFIDVFVLMGGCGTLLALLLALFIFSKKNSTRSLSILSAFPMLFNINEIMVFGLPIIYNPIFLIPFVVVPIVTYLISFFAAYVGLVPLTIHSVEWTTPILLGGFKATGSVAGAVLQAVSVSIGVMIYMPFVKLYDKEREQASKRNISRLTGIMRRSEETNKEVVLTEIEGICGDIAKQLVNDLKSALTNDELFMQYQRQCNQHGEIIGAEALIRWKHPIYNMIYPPLIIKLAKEADVLPLLESYVFKKVKSDIEKNDISIKISINATPVSLKNNNFVEMLKESFPDGCVKNSHICIEVTEQTELVTDRFMTDTIKSLGEIGFLFAIDDFSMGFTSLKYLQENRFDIVKLDGSLVRGLEENESCAEIISSIVYLASSMSFDVLAEYVETEELRQQLEEIGCVIYQGYLFGKPESIQSLRSAINDRINIL